MNLRSTPGFRIAAIATLLILETAFAPASAGPPSTEQTPHAIHCAALTIDSHIDVPSTFATSEVDPGRDGEAQLTLTKMQRGCLDAAFFIAAVGQNGRTAAHYAHAWDEAGKMIAAVHRMTMQYPDRIVLARTADDIVRITSSGRRAALIGLENAYPLGEDLTRLRTLFDLGVRYVTLTHTGHNAWADSSTPLKELGDPPEEHGGLSNLGRRLIARMNCLGIMVDVSHTSKKTSMQAIEASRAPVIASHSGVRAVADLPRNLDDEQLRLLAQRKGVVQVVGYSHYIRPDSAEKTQAIARVGGTLGLNDALAWASAPNAVLVEYGRGLVALDARWPRASIADYVDHIDHIVKLVGIDHVGVGSDFYAGGSAPSGGLTGWMDVSQGEHVTEELLRRGYSDPDIAKIWGGNLLRVLQETQEIANSACPADASA